MQIISGRQVHWSQLGNALNGNSARNDFSALLIAKRFASIGNSDVGENGGSTDDIKWRSNVAASKLKHVDTSPGAGVGGWGER